MPNDTDTEINDRVATCLEVMGNAARAAGFTVAEGATAALLLAANAAAIADDQSKSVVGLRTALDSFHEFYTKSRMLQALDGVVS